MGCVSSKFAKGDFNQEETNGNLSNHVVSLTSSTYGVLQLEPIKEPKRSPSPTLPKFHKKGFEEPEIINAWELMEDLDEEITICSPARRTPKSHLEKKAQTFFSQMRTPKKQKNLMGKENRKGEGGRHDSSAKQGLRPFGSLENLQPVTPGSKLRTKNAPPHEMKLQGVGNNLGFSTSRRSFSPLFDPELLASFERELSEEGEQIKKMVSPVPRGRKSRISESMIELFEKKCPPGGEDAVVLYTTTLRGIRKTFEDCNRVRSLIESHCVQMIERDISMDSGFREELRVLMEKKEVRVPVVFVKGRLIGDADEVLKLEEEGKLSFLLEGIPQAAEVCQGCGGLRFVMCLDCSGSCKVLDAEQKSVVRCGECNENGLIQCPICC
ncbi:Glutaredoxin domain-containing protein [Cinnamomum micranthum f. kanehirae]|uniref:Glutaredoxin domain-containing protein n=1 Tax=Cinnamomum micranthum f. kanehirae TaxID=337451 RepID=A0A443Q4M6_9MAGN|nr:Glutaredoxin domain-containing protein [Cinnamomum micranthum f. kanehirae]